MSAKERETRAAADYAADYAKRLADLLARLPFERIADAVERLTQARDAGRTVFTFGNGGAAATASHLACDLGKGASLGRERRFRVLSLGENRAWTTALANDVAYDAVFVEEMKNFLEAGDVCVALSASGRSRNVLEAARYARSKKASVIGISGFGGGDLAGLSDIPVVLPGEHMGLVEDLQMAACHVIGYYFMEKCR